MIFAKNNFLS